MARCLLRLASGRAAAAHADAIATGQHAEALGVRNPIGSSAPSSIAVGWVIAHLSSPRMSSAVMLLANRSLSSMTPRNSAALRCASATTFSSMVSRAISR
jgi:hypothetical protein